MATQHTMNPKGDMVMIGAQADLVALELALLTDHRTGTTLEVSQPPFTFPDPNPEWILVSAVRQVTALAETHGLDVAWRFTFVAPYQATATITPAVKAGV